ncbi:MAG: UDP-N-acetylmuramoyl-tripeptide--D-alanyl-D-alanine ligase [Candidatus Saganbacteria bacterium]|nr:UDP-N-acetylmuramoyl-tripeptide--D-alanyl-D-alanine ligase [Candidatus Saganbacteria bacterium]
MFKREEIMGIVKGARVRGPGSSFRNICTDTRRIKRGDLFIPLKGKKFDGNKFRQAALKKGAAVLEVRDGLKALQDLAAYHRLKFNIPIIGVTGSSGKTTTKDMIAAVLSQQMSTLKNEENFNNEIGVPLTLLRLRPQHKAAVIEMAMQGLGEIELLARIARPTISVVTNIGEAHLEFLKTKRNVARAKAEIFKYLGPKDHAVINADDEYYERLTSRLKLPISSVVTFGIIEKADITPKMLKGIKLPLPGEHMIYNALAVIAVARILGLKKKRIKRGLEVFRPSSNRWDVINRRDGVKIINDTYNANPQSMTAALKVLAWLQGRKIAVLGDMFELGRRSRAAHGRIGRLCRSLGIDRLISIGKAARAMRADHHFATKAPAIRKLKSLIRPGDRILVKASRGMHLEEVVEAIRKI